EPDGTAEPSGRHGGRPGTGYAFPCGLHLHGWNGVRDTARRTCLGFVLRQPELCCVERRLQQRRCSQLKGADLTNIEFSSDMGVELIEAWGSDRKVAQSARVSTLGLDNDREKIAGLVKALWRDGHYSPFESSGVTVAFDVPMFVRDQLVRHKSFAFSVKSLRYSEAAPKFYVPSGARPLVQVGKALDYRREAGS